MPLLLFASIWLPVGCAHLGRQSAPKYQTIADNLSADAKEASRLVAKGTRSLEHGHLETAEKSLRSALDIDISNGPAHNALGTVYFRQRKLYLAAWEYQYAAKLMPERSEPFNNLGLTFEKAGRLDEAVDWYARGLAIDAKNPELMGNLARAKIRRGDKDTVVESLLDDLILHDTRANWITWAEDELVKRRYGKPTPPELSQSKSPEVK